MSESSTGFLFASMDRGATFSADRRYRYSLWRTWDASLPIVAFIGLNPSTADENVDDPTIRRCIGFAKSWGYGGLLMLNIFAFRATDPDVMKAEADPVGLDNDLQLLRSLVEAKERVAAWGVHGVHRQRDSEVKRILGSLTCLGKTKDGHPKHPLYIPKNAERIVY